jgi:hypothetical protein
MGLSLGHRTRKPTARARSVSIVALAGALLIGLCTATATAATRPLGAHASATSIFIRGVAAVPGGSGAWAVGFARSSTPPDNDVAVIWKWWGSKWVTESIPSLGDDGSLTSVVATSESNAWALGLSGPSASSTDPVLLHWNGRSWKIVKFPTADDADDFGPLAAAGSGVFVGGGTGGSPSFPVLLAYKGSAWTTEKLPIFSANTSLEGLSATSAARSGLWGVATLCGSSLCTSSVLKPGKSGWSPVSAGGKGTVLFAVAALSPANVLAVGDSQTTSESYGKLLIKRSKGSSWTAVKVPSPIATGDFFYTEMSAATAGWAAGDTFTSTSEAVIVDRLKGKRWAHTIVKIPGKNGVLVAFSGGSGSAAWLFARSYAGAVCSSLSTVVAEHWNGSTWSLVKTPPWTLGAATRIPSSSAVNPRC